MTGLQLTPKERSILDLLSRGENLKKAAFILNITHATAKTYMCSVHRRNSLTTHQLMFLYGQERAAQNMRRFFEHREVA